MNIYKETKNIPPTVKYIKPPGRIICISDIHGCLDLLVRLLDETDFGSDDTLLLLGDLYTKGKHGHQTLRYIMKLIENSKNNPPYVHALRGNCDWIEDYLNAEEAGFIERLPHIIETEQFTFVHGGIKPGGLAGQSAWACMKNDAFMERGYCFDKYVVTGHWPTYNYAHEIPCYDPVVDEKNRIISIDGGTVIKSGGQLNAFIIDADGRFSFRSADNLPKYKTKRTQTESAEVSLNITWNDRRIELIEKRADFSLYRHIATGREIELPDKYVWLDNEGNLCGTGDNYRLGVKQGEIVSVIGFFPGRIHAKCGSISGWIYLDE